MSYNIKFAAFTKKKRVCIARFSEAVLQRGSIKNVFLIISQNSQENTCARVSLLKNKLWHRYFPVNFAKFLRVFTGKKHPQIRPQRFWKEWMRTFGWLAHGTQVFWKRYAFFRKFILKLKYWKCSKFPVITK